MDDIIGPIKTYFAKRDPSTIENATFKLHVRVTFALMLACMALVGAGMFGDPIDCMADGVPGGAMNLFCWIHSTFSVSSRSGVSGDVYGHWASDNAVNGVQEPHPGVAPTDGELLTYHKYYQWVIFFFFVQAVMFYIPRLVWKHAEGGLMKKLVGGLTDPLIPYQREEREKQVDSIRRYFKEDLRSHGGYAINFFLCELLTLVNVVGQIYFTDRFLGYQFTTYGLDVVKMTTMDPEDRADPMNVVFPKVTKCTFHMYGPSGTVTRHDGLCILALNIINEKIFVFLWFWFVVLAVISAAAVLYRVATLASLALRVRAVMNQLHGQVHESLVRDVLTSPAHSWIDQIGDYWVMFLLTKNLPAVAMKELLEQLKPILNPSPQYGYTTLDKDTPMKDLQ